MRDISQGLRSDLGSDVTSVDTSSNVSGVAKGRVIKYESSEEMSKKRDDLKDKMPKKSASRENKFCTLHYDSSVPWKFIDFNDADLQLKQWAGNPNKEYSDGQGNIIRGGFPLKFANKMAQGLTGNRRTWMCTHSGCTFRIYAHDVGNNDVLEGCEVASMIPQHTHELTQTRAQANVDPLSRCIPAHLVDLGEKLTEAGLGPADVFRALAHKIPENELTFTKTDIKNRFRRTHDQIELDATNLASELLQRSKEKGLFSDIATEQNGQLKNVYVFYMCPHD